jgi:hypothetical protein
MGMSRSGNDHKESENWNEAGVDCSRSKLGTGQWCSRSALSMFMWMQGARYDESEVGSSRMWYE